MAGRQKLEIPLYLFLGFLESGKTTFIKETLEEDYFNDGQKTLIIACEEGIEEYDDDILEASNSVLVYVEDEEDFTKDFLISKVVQYAPDRVILEYNGMWSVENLTRQLEGTPLLLFQGIVTMNAETFDLYMNNMRSLAVEMFKVSELVIINRCRQGDPRATWRRSIRAVNRQTQVMFDSEDPSVMQDVQEELPFDISGDEITIEDEDYGIWFIDAMDHPEHYDGKTLHMKARIFKSLRMPRGTFVPGRHAMTCCADDIQFIGYL